MNFGNRYIISEIFISIETGISLQFLSHPNLRITRLSGFAGNSGYFLSLIPYYLNFIFNDFNSLEFVGN